MALFINLHVSAVNAPGAQGRLPYGGGVIAGIVPVIGGLLLLPLPLALTTRQHFSPLGCPLVKQVPEPGIWFAPVQEEEQIWFGVFKHVPFPLVVGPQLIPVHACLVESIVPPAQPQTQLPFGPEQ